MPVSKLFPADVSTKTPTVIGVVKTALRERQ